MMDPRSPLASSLGDGGRNGRRFRFGIESGTIKRADLSVKSNSRQMRLPAPIEKTSGYSSADGRLLSACCWRQI